MNKINIQEITSTLDTLKDLKARLSFELKECEKGIEKEELKLIALLNQTGVKEMVHGVYSFGFKETSRCAFDQKLFAEKEPDLYNKYKLTKLSEKFEFKINK